MILGSEQAANNEPNREVQLLIGALDVPVDDTPITSGGIREAFAEFVRDLNARGELQPVAHIIDEVVIDSAIFIPVRRYEPTDNPDELLDVVVFIHGGGWVAGDLETAEGPSRALAAGLGCRVVSIEYRLAPEVPFPGALEDCIAVVRHIQRQISTRHVFVAGESAGGNLAAAVAFAMRNDEMALSGQVLINPALDLANESPSYERLGVGYGLRASDMRAYANWYAANTDRNNALLSPLLADSLTGVAPALVITAGFDPLHDEGIAYVDRLLRHNVPVVSLPMPTMLHGWWSLLPVSAEARRQSSRVMGAIKFLQSLANDAAPRDS